MKIWLTGGSGCGKSAAAAIFAENGFKIVDADAIAREIVLPDKEAYREILATFGEEFRGKDGFLDRRKLGRAVFSDGEKLALLNGITHKHIIKEMLIRSEGEKNVIYDAPLRNTFGVPCDKTLCMTAPKEVRIRRIMTRDGISYEDAEARISAQSTEAEYLGDADGILENNGDLVKLREEAEAYIKEWYTP